jgi:plastocyanin
VPPTHSATPTITLSVKPTAKPSTKPTHSSTPIVTPSQEAPTGGTVTMGNFQYAMPDSVAPGSRIAIFNADTVGHTLTIASAGIDVVVDGGRYGYLTAPATPGSYQVTCDYHADMVATLVVR